MSDKVQLFFLDFGLTNMQEGVLQGRILTCNGEGSGLKTVVQGIRAMPGL